MSTISKFDISSPFREVNFRPNLPRKRAETVELTASWGSWRKLKSFRKAISKTAKRGPVASGTRALCASTSFMFWPEPLQLWSREMSGRLDVSHWVTFQITWVKKVFLLYLATCKVTRGICVQCQFWRKIKTEQVHGGRFSATEAQLLRNRSGVVLAGVTTPAWLTKVFKRHQERSR